MFNSGKVYSAYVSVGTCVSLWSELVRACVVTDDLPSTVHHCCHQCLVFFRTSLLCGYLLLPCMSNCHLVDCPSVVESVPQCGHPVSANKANGLLN